MCAEGAEVNCTEEEAKSKLCCGPGIICLGVTVAAASVAGRVEKVPPETLHCKGSVCMAWRWIDPLTLNEQGGSAAEYSSLDRRGYCGLAGKP